MKCIFLLSFLSFNLFAQYDPEVIGEFLAQGDSDVADAQANMGDLGNYESASVICYNFMYPLSSGLGVDEESARTDGETKFVLNRCLQHKLYGILDIKKADQQFLAPGVHPDVVIDISMKHAAGMRELMVSEEIAQYCKSDPTLMLALGALSPVTDTAECGPIDGDYKWLKNKRTGEPLKFRGDEGYIYVYEKKY